MCGDSYFDLKKSAVLDRVWVGALGAARAGTALAVG
jgi:hypothetical protein